MAGQDLGPVVERPTAAQTVLAPLRVSLGFRAPPSAPVPGGPGPGASGAAVPAATASITAPLAYNSHSDDLASPAISNDTLLLG